MTKKNSEILENLSANITSSSDGIPRLSLRSHGSAKKSSSRRNQTTILAVETLDSSSVWKPTIKEFDNHLRASGNELNTRLVYISLDIARYMSENYNLSNRNLDVKRTARMNRDMLANKWILSGQGVSFGYDKDEDMPFIADGQHRLGAIVEANDVSSIGGQVFICTFGYKKEHMHIFDQNKPRTLHDNLKISGETDATKMTSSIINAFINLCFNRTNVAHRASHSERKSVFHEFKDSIMWSENLLKDHRKVRGLSCGFVSATFAKAHRHVMEVYDKKERDDLIHDIEVFYGNLIEGTNLSKVASQFRTLARETADRRIRKTRKVKDENGNVLDKKVSNNDLSLKLEKILNFYLFEPESYWKRVRVDFPKDEEFPVDISKLINFVSTDSQ